MISSNKIAQTWEILLARAEQSQATLLSRDPPQDLMTKECKQKRRFGTGDPF
jgi:hypothetical protein